MQHGAQSGASWLYRLRCFHPVNYFSLGETVSQIKPAIRPPHRVWDNKRCSGTRSHLCLKLISFSADMDEDFTIRSSFGLLQTDPFTWKPAAALSLMIIKRWYFHLYLFFYRWLSTLCVLWLVECFSEAVISWLSPVFFSPRWWIRELAFISHCWPDKDLVLIAGWKSRFVKHDWFTEADNSSTGQQWSPEGWGREIDRGKRAKETR